jgi:hypothetical protein
MMINMRMIWIALFLPALLTASDDLSRLTGTWKGQSLCVAKNTACRDETVVYRIARVPGKPDYVSVDADKIVDGKPLNMGTLEFQYLADRHALLLESPQGTWRLQLEGRTLDGTLTRHDGTVFRHVTVKSEQ